MQSVDGRAPGPVRARRRAAAVRGEPAPDRRGPPLLDRLPPPVSSGPGAARRSTTGPARWPRAAAPGARHRRDLLAAGLAEDGCDDEVAATVLGALPEQFDDEDSSGCSADAATPTCSPAAPTPAHRRTNAPDGRRPATPWPSPPDTALHQRVLWPAAADGGNGMEDARFVRFVDDDGAVDYHATYTAYDGRHIAARSCSTPTTSGVPSHRRCRAGAPEQGHGAVPAPGRRPVPRAVPRGRRDHRPGVLDDDSAGRRPRCSTPRPRLGADPARQLRLADRDRRGLAGAHPRRRPDAAATRSARCCSTSTTRPRSSAGCPAAARTATDDERDGYVPNVVYSCGALVHAGRCGCPTVPAMPGSNSPPSRRPRFSAQWSRAPLVRRLGRMSAGGAARAAGWSPAAGAHRSGLRPAASIEDQQGRAGGDGDAADAGQDGQAGPRRRCRRSRAASCGWAVRWAARSVCRSVCPWGGRGLAGWRAGRGLGGRSASAGGRRGR